MGISRPLYLATLCIGDSGPLPTPFAYCGCVGVRHATLAPASHVKALHRLQYRILPQRLLCIVLYCYCTVSYSTVLCCIVCYFVKLFDCFVLLFHITNATTSCGATLKSHLPMSLIWAISCLDLPNDAHSRHTFATHLRDRASQRDDAVCPFP